MNTLVALVEVAFAAYHSVEEIFAFVAVGVDEGNGSFALGNLSVGVAAETDAAVYPADLCQKSGELVCHQPCIEGLVEVYAVATADNLLHLPNGIVTSGEDVVIH